MPAATPHKKFQVLLVDDHPMLREHLAELINKDQEMSVCGETESVEGALALMEESLPDIAIVDLNLQSSSGLEFLRNLRARRVGVPVLILSMHDETLYAERALRAGARGYITKHQASSEMMRAIRKVLAGEVYLNRQMTSELIQRMSGQRRAVDKSGVALLADRELEVFQLIGQGKNTHEIARELGLGESTVATLRARIKEKLSVKDVAELYHRATEWMKDQEKVA